MSDNRIIWIDWMRVIACFMVMLVHSTEPFYLGGDGSLIESRADLYWVAFFDSIVRACVPIFVIASCYLQFPNKYTSTEFFKRRATRILIPFAIWSVFYAFWFGEPVENLKGLLLNFNYAAGHLWFVYMLIGIYMLIPILSPWAEKVSRKELSIYICIWTFTTIIPFIRECVSSNPIAITYGPTGIPKQAFYPVWGEASWNAYGTFYYFSGFIGYMLIGLWFRKFSDHISKTKSIIYGIIANVIGFAICFGGFIHQVLKQCGGVFPAAGTVQEAVVWEVPWCFDTLGVALMAVGAIFLIRTIKCQGKLYERIILPVSQASYGMYLCHMVAIVFYSGLFRDLLNSTPLTIICTALASYTSVAIFATVVRRIPWIGRFIIG